MRRHCTIASAGLLLIAATPPLAGWWEAGLVRHMLMQIPMLVLSGILLARAVTPRVTPAVPVDNAKGVATVLVAAFCLTFWMLPRWLDAAVADGRVDAAKIGTLVLLAGLPLGWGWPRLGTVAKAFVWSHLIAMFAILGVLYLGFPDRLCNSYLISEQSVLGQAMLGLAVLVGMFCGAAALFRSDAAAAEPIPEQASP